MFGIGSTELLVILLVALVVLGPKSLASVSRSLGKAMGEFRRVSTDFQRTLNAEVAREEEDEKQRKAAEAKPAPSSSPSRATADASRRTETAAQTGKAEPAEPATLDTTARPATESEGPVPPQGSPLEKAVAATQAAAQTAPATEAQASGSERA